MQYDIGLPLKIYSQIMPVAQGPSSAGLTYYYFSKDSIDQI